jgi:hypothetical protein
MRNHNPTSRDSGSFVPGRRYNGLRGKVVDSVEHSFEEASYTSTFASRTKLSFAGRLPRA